MKFRLTYEGRLEGNGTPKHKHEIRKQLHPQLKRLWAMEPNLKAWQAEGRLMMERALDEVALSSGGFNTASGKHSPHHLATQFNRGNYRYVPLATTSQSIIAALEILFLRSEPPGGVIRSADLDNRLKTLFDALRMPGNETELGGYDTPGEDEDPFYVLLEDDKLISHVSVETDTLLQPTPTANGQFLANDARLIMTVTLKPSLVTMENLHFV